MVQITDTKFRLTEPKEVYNEFKFFKNIYTKINFTEEIILTGNSKEKCVDIYFLFDTTFFKLCGKLYEDTEFLKWLKDGDKQIRVKMEHLINLGKALKKNVDDVEFDTDYFVFHYKNKENYMVSLCLKPQKKELFPDFDSKFSNNFIIESSYLEHDIFQIFREGENITNIRTKNKIIEIPRDRIFSLIKNEEVSFAFTEKDNIESQLVRISTESKDLKLKLTQYFRTI